ncbi:MAG: hypothetical protein AB7V56_16725 [Candidatus Nitrosocosmicus sp.]|jgi:hypothetical protein
MSSNNKSSSAKSSGNFSPTITAGGVVIDRTIWKLTRFVDFIKTLD